MGLREIIPQDLQKKYAFDERGHASAILSTDFPTEFGDLLFCLRQFKLNRSHVIVGGGGKSQISMTLDKLLRSRGWSPKTFRVGIDVDDNETPLGTHEIDEFKNAIGVEIEWNNKTEFYDRDLTHFRLMHDSGIIAVGVMITRLYELQEIFDELGIGTKYGKSTTIWEKLIPKVNMGSAGGCPLLLVGIGKACYDPRA